MMMTGLCKNLTFPFKKDANLSSGWRQTYRCYGVGQEGTIALSSMSCNPAISERSTVMV